jgi:hypothetical protein
MESAANANHGAVAKNGVRYPYHLSLLENARHSEHIGVTGAPWNPGNILDSGIHWNDGKK